MQFALSTNDYNLTEFKLDLFRIVCSHEHYITLNLPLLPLIDPPSPTDKIPEDEDSSDIKLMATLNKGFLQHHYLTGLVLSELDQLLTKR